MLIHYIKGKLEAARAKVKGKEKKLDPWRKASPEGSGIDGNIEDSLPQD